MSFTQHLGQVVSFLHQDATPNVDYSIRWNGVESFVDLWDVPTLGSLITEQQELDAINDVTTVNGQTFTQWKAEHNGGVPGPTDRRIISEKIEQVSVLGMELRELVATVNRVRSFTVNRLDEITEALDAVKATSGPADNIRNAIPSSWLATNTRDRRESIQEFIDDLPNEETPPPP